MGNSAMVVLANVVPFIVVVGIFYFVMIVPERKRKKKFEEMVSSLKMNDEIVTRGGIVGRIYHVDDKYVTIESGPAKTRIKLDKSGIAYKIGDNK